MDNETGTGKDHQTEIQDETRELNAWQQVTELMGKTPKAKLLNTAESIITGPQKP